MPPSYHSNPHGRLDELTRSRMQGGTSLQAYVLRTGMEIRACNEIKVAYFGTWSVG